MKSASWSVENSPRMYNPACPAGVIQHWIGDRWAATVTRIFSGTTCAVRIHAPGCVLSGCVGPAGALMLGVRGQLYLRRGVGHVARISHCKARISQNRVPELNNPVGMACARVGAQQIRNGKESSSTCFDQIQVSCGNRVQISRRAPPHVK